MSDFADKNLNEKKVVVKFLIEDKLLFILFQDGKIVTYDTLNNEFLDRTIDLLCDVDSAMFSGDQELLAVCTQDKRLLLFNKLMMLKCQYDMTKDEYGTNELINVNWGSKDTQFHGEGMRDKRVSKEVLSISYFSFFY